MWLDCYDNTLGNRLCRHFSTSYVKMLCAEVKIRLKSNDCEHKRHFGLVLLEGYSHTKTIRARTRKASIRKTLELNMACCAKWNSSFSACMLTTWARETQSLEKTFYFQSAGQIMHSLAGRWKSLYTQSSVDDTHEISEKNSPSSPSFHCYWNH